MTDFLTRLAERTLGLASVVQPRLAARYASWVEMDNDNTFATPSTIVLASHSVTAPVGLGAVQTSSDAQDHPNPQRMRSSDPLLPHTRNDLLSGKMGSNHAASHSELESEHTLPMSQTETLPLGSSDVHQGDAFHLKETSQPWTSDPVRSTKGLADRTPFSNPHDLATPLVASDGDAVQPSSDALDHPSPQLMRSGDPLVPHTMNNLLSGQMTSKQAASHSELESEHTPPMRQIETSPLGSSDVHQLDAFHLKVPSRPRVSEPVRSTAGLVDRTPLSNQHDLATPLVAPNGDAVPPTELRTTSPLGRPPSSVVPQTIEQPGHQAHAHASYIPLVPASNELNNTTSQQTNLASALVRLEENSLSTSAVDPSFLNRVPSSTTQPGKNHERTIEIRIGRVEVRGIQADTPTQQARSTPSTPALSLSDYLNQRDGSNR